MTSDVPSTDTAGGWQGRAKSAQQAALEYLLHGLRTGRYRAGEQIVPEAVAAEVGVSHVPVREAVRKLEGRGTLTHVPRKGYFVTKLDVDDLKTLIVLGRLLETEALRDTAPVISSDQIVRMRAAIADGRGRVGNDPIGVAAACRTFHNVMLEQGVPRLLRSHLDLLWSTMEPYRPLIYTSERNQLASCTDHAAIVDAIESGDLDKTIGAYDQHRTNILHSLREVLWFADIGVD